MQATEQEKRLARYLLGDLPQSERSEIEKDYLTGSDSYDQLLVAEDQLIDDYVRDKLSTSDIRRFEQNFMSTSERRERVKSARALMAFADKYGKSNVEARKNAWQSIAAFLRLESQPARLLVAAGLVLTLVAGSLMLMRISRLNSELQSLKQTQIAQQQHAADLEQEIVRQNESFNKALADERRNIGKLEQDVENVRDESRAKSQSSPPPLIFALGAGSADGFPRGSDSPRFVVSKERPKVKLEFDVPIGGGRSYLVSLLDPQGKEIWRGDVPSKGTKVSVTLATRLFSNGTYRILLADSEASVGFERYYQVEVEKK